MRVALQVRVGAVDSAVRLFDLQQSVSAKISRHAWMSELTVARRSLPRLFAERMVKVVAVVLIISARLQSGRFPGTSLQPLVT